MKLHDVMIVVLTLVCIIALILVGSYYVRGGMIIDKIQQDHALSSVKESEQKKPFIHKDRAETEFYIKGAKLFDLMIKQLERMDQDGK